MKIKLKNTPEQEALIRAMGSRVASESIAAQEAFAAFLGPVVSQVLQKAATAGQIFTDTSYDPDDSPSFPLDLYYNEGAGYVSVYSQNMAGGIPTSQDVFAGQELKFSPYRLDSAVSFTKKYARRGRLDVISKAVERMAQEVLVKQERNAWAVVLKALSSGSTQGLSHVINSGTGSGSSNMSFSVALLSQLMTRIKRINSAFNGTVGDSTPSAAFSKGVTDLYVSPEVMQAIRGFAYQPVSISTTNDALPTTLTNLPDSAREEIYRGAGAQSIFGVNLVELLELGVGKKYTTLFGSFYTSSNFTAGNHEVLVGVDNSKGAFIRAIATNADTGAAFTALPDDQFNQRAEKIGFYGSLEEARVCVDSRAVAGITLQPAS